MRVGQRVSSKRKAAELEAAFNALYRANVEQLLGWFQRRTFSAQVSADLCAETFAVALERFDAYDPERGDLGAWLWGIARNLLRQYHRSEAVSVRARAKLSIVTADVADDDLDRIDREVDLPVIEKTVARALSQLSPSLSAAVRLRVIDGEAYEEVARRCDCSVGAARVRVSRGLAQLLDDPDLADAWEVQK